MKSIKSAVIPIIGINIVFFILQLMIQGFTENLMLISSDIFVRPWILITSMFLHGGVSHLLFNMYVLLIFGPLLEQRIGPKRFLLVYMLSGLIAAFLSSFFYSRALGASGAIMGMIGTLIILLPNLKILFFFVIPMPLWIAGIVIAALDFFGIFSPSNVANIAHLVGMGCGLLYGVIIKKKSKRFQKKFSQKRHLDSDDIDEYFKTGRI